MHTHTHTRVTPVELAGNTTNSMNYLPQTFRPFVQLSLIICVVGVCDKCNYLEMFFLCRRILFGALTLAHA